MTAGFRVYNADGSIAFDTGNRVFRLLTVADANAVNGSVSVDSNGGEIVAVAIPNTFADKETPSVSVSGGTVSWSYSSSPANRESSQVIIMAY